MGLKHGLFLPCETNECVDFEGSTEENKFAQRVRKRRRNRHSEERHNLYASPIIIRVIKLRRMRWAVL